MLRNKERFFYINNLILLFFVLLQLFYALCDGFNALAVGATIGYPSSALLSMYKDPNFEVTEEQVSMLIAYINI